MEETRLVRVEITREKGEVSEFKVEIPAGLELSEEEMRKIAEATANDIVDVISGSKAERAPTKFQVEPITHSKTKAIW